MKCKYLIAAALAMLCLASCGKEDAVDPIYGGDALPSAPDGRLPGLFSVSASRQVCFAQGNLQWSATGSHAVADGTKSGTWRFATHQYDVVGSPSQYDTAMGPAAGCQGNVGTSDNALIAEDYIGWIDLFGWGTSGYHGCNPYWVRWASYEYGDGDTSIAGTNFDWGVYNAISNGGNLPGRWRTLTRSEWDYLLNSRLGAAEKFAVGRIELAAGSYVNGCILLPDSWELPEGCGFTPGTSASTDYSLNSYTFMQWSQMEAAGAVFLPAAGARTGTEVDNVGYAGYYWSSSYCSNLSSFAPYCSYTFTFHSAVQTLLCGCHSRSNGLSVRLVHDMSGDF